MNTKAFRCAFVLLALVVASASAQEPRGHLRAPVDSSSPELLAQAQETPSLSEPERYLPEPPKTETIVQAPVLGPQFPIGLAKEKSKASEPEKNLPEPTITDTFAQPPVMEPQLLGSQLPMVLVKEKAKLPEPEKKLPEPPITDIFAEAPVMGPQFPTGFNPQMMGDLGIILVRKSFTFTGTLTTTTTTSLLRGFNGSPPTPNPPIVTTTTTTVPVTQTRTILVPIATSAAAFKVAENESPRPVDRVFGAYNYFGAIRGGVFASGPPQSASASTTSAPAPISQDVTTVTTNANAVFTTPQLNTNIHREVVGFEKTFLDGYASIELRVPFLQTNSSIDSFGGQNAGDITVVTKYAFHLDARTGNVVSAGLAVTVPSGPAIDTLDGSLHSTLLQPWFGYIWNFNSFFIQGIHSIVVPTDSRDVTLLFNDIAVNFWLYRGGPDRFLNYIVPLAEVHVTTPWNHRDGQGVIFVPDQVVVTGGVHVGFMRNTSVSVGVATPVSGPRLFNVEAFAQFNWRF